MEVDERFALLREQNNAEADCIVDSPADPARLDGIDYKTVLLAAVQPFDDKHQECEQECETGNLRDAKKSGGKKTTYYIEGLSDVFRPENDPTDDGEEERQQHLQEFFDCRQHSAFGHDVGIAAVFAK